MADKAHGGPVSLLRVGQRRSDTADAVIDCRVLRCMFALLD